MQAWKFEQKVFEREGVRIVVRAPSETKVGKFGYAKCARGNTSISSWLETRIYPLTGDHEVMVVNGRGEIYPHGSTYMSTLRATYEKD